MISTYYGQFFSSFGGIIIIIVVFAQDEVFSLKWIQDSYTVGLSPRFFYYVLLCWYKLYRLFYLTCQVFGTLWKASWMFTLAPLPAPNDLWRGVQATALLYIVVPCTLVMLCIATVIWGALGVFYALPGLVTLLYYIIFYPKPPSNLPLTQEFVQKRAVVGAWLPFVFNILAIGVFVGIQFLTYLLNIWVYYTFYSVGIVGGLIGFVYFWKRK